MKYSLRSLMIVVTLGCILLGIRVENLRHRAEFHEREAASIVGRVRRLSVEFGFVIWDSQDVQMHEHHQSLAKEYRAAVCRPWSFVKEQTPDAEIELEKLAKSLVPTRSSTQ